MHIASTPDHSALWARIETHCFSANFINRLARDHLWSPAFAAAALEEYRRYCFLAIISPSPVTPSEEVDEVWHLHLLHSRDYWDIWCGQVLGTRLHHDPTEGGPAALAKHAEQYAQTLALYEQHFGPPPEPFWPSTQSRFHNAARFRAVDARAWLIMPRVTAFFTKRRLPFPTR